MACQLEPVHQSGPLCAAAVSVLLIPVARSIVWRSFSRGRDGLNRSRAVDSLAIAIDSELLIPHTRGANAS